MIHIIIDGYNLIRQVPSLMRHEKQSLESGRQHLIHLLSLYRNIKRHKITVIFDGVLNLSEFAPSYKEAGINIKFSPQGISADDVIKEMVRDEKSRAMVVSSDQSILKYARDQGSSVISSPDFYEKLAMAQMMGTLDKEEPPEKETPKHKRWLTYKKGPSKKPPKKERRNRQRMKKL